MNEKSDTILYCSFCGKSQHEVKKLIAGPRVFICDECVVLCVAIVYEKGSLDKDGTPAEARLIGQTEAMRSILNQVDEIVARERKFMRPYEELAADAQRFREDFGIPSPKASESVVAIKDISQPAN